jgi:hypothetical protein
MFSETPLYHEVDQLTCKVSSSKTSHGEIAHIYGFYFGTFCNPHGMIETLLSSISIKSLGRLLTLFTEYPSNSLSRRNSTYLSLKIVSQWGKTSSSSANYILSGQNIHLWRYPWTFHGMSDSKKTCQNTVTEYKAPDPVVATSTDCTIIEATDITMP